MAKYSFCLCLQLLNDDQINLNNPIKYTVNDYNF